VVNDPIVCPYGGWIVGPKMLAKLVERCSNGEACKCRATHENLVAMRTSK